MKHIKNYKDLIHIGEYAYAFKAEYNTYSTDTVEYIKNHFGKIIEINGDEIVIEYPEYFYNYWEPGETHYKTGNDYAFDIRDIVYHSKVKDDVVNFVEVYNTSKQYNL